MTHPSRQRGASYGAAAGAVVGAIVAVLVLSLGSAPLEYQWPASDTPLGGYLAPGTTEGFGLFALPTDCSSMLIDLNSTVPAMVWAAPWGTPVNFNATSFGGPFYFWSGAVAVDHLSVVVSILRPGAGMSVTVRDTSATENGSALFNIWFPSSGCG